MTSQREESGQFRKTSKQEEAIRIMASSARNIMLYGGSRSGKTFIILYAIIVRACKAKSRHLVVRLRFNHVKTSVWLDTLPKVMSLCFPSLPYKSHDSDFYITLPNGSEIWIAGLDDKIRTEKVLGKEYSTIFFNECSQIPWESRHIAMTRLAEKNKLKKKAFYDENPPNKRHWSYWVFKEYQDPEENTPLDSSKYASILMNPVDNLDNIDEDYITEILDELPLKQRQRFKDGEFTDDGMGLIYYAFSREKNIQAIQRNPHLPIYIGLDFNVNPMTAVVSNIEGNTVKVFDEIWLEDSNTPEMIQEIKGRYPSANINIVPDFTGGGRKTVATKGGNSDHALLEQAFGRDHLHVGLNPFRMDRYNAVNKGFEDQNIIINKSCKKLIRDLEQCAFKEGSTMLDTNNPMLGHISDGLGYLYWRFFGIRPVRHSRTIQL